MSGLRYSLRAVQPGDTGFIARSMVDSARGGTKQTRLIDTKLFSAWMYPEIEKLLASPETTIRIACAHDDETVIYGFLVASGDVVHMVYVRKAMRRMGIAGALAQGIAPTAFSLWTQDVSEWILMKYHGLKHCPLWLNRKASDGERNAEAA